MTVKEEYNRATRETVDLAAPIGPQKGVDGWKDLPIAENGEKLVPLGVFSEHNKIFSDGIYFGEGASSPYKLHELNGALLTPFVREGVAQRLAHAASLLPDGYAFMVWDSYRPLEVQQALFDDYYNQLVDKKGMEPEKAKVEAQRFVSIPSTDATKPPPHNTGGAVDLTIVHFTPEAWQEMQQLEKEIAAADKKDDWQAVYKAEMRRLQLLHEATPLDMGTAFDQVSPETLTRFYEEKVENGETLSTADQARLENRRMFVNAMQAAGFSNYPEEWWHFDYGNQFAAARTGEPAVYGAAAFTQENAEWEEMRAKHFAGTVGMQAAKTIYPAVKLSSEMAPAEFAQFIAERAPDIRPSFKPVAKRLEA